MNKTTEALKLAENTLRDIIRVYKFEGGTPVTALSAIREALAEQDHLADTGKMIAEPVKQEPVAHYKDAPHTIYLQTGCDDPEDCECSFNEWGDTTWCADQIHDTDIPYIRADYAAPVSAKREWVDLTDDEKGKVWGDWYVSGFYNEELIDRAITAFKEKNK